MFAGAAREAVFSNPDVIRRIKADFIPVAIKAGQLNKPPDNLEGRLYRDMGRSKPAPQGICVVNSDSKVLAWTLMFDNNKSVLGFLDHCKKRYQQFPNAQKSIAAQRYMRFPSRKLPDVADSGTVIGIAKGATSIMTPPLPKGTLVGRVIGRALDKKGKPVADTRRQEHYLEARFSLPVDLQQRFGKALAEAGDTPFRIPDEMAFAVVSHAYLGQLDVNPLGGRRVGGKTTRRDLSLSAQKVVSTNNEVTRVYIFGRSDVAGQQGGIGARTDGRKWSHQIKLDWEGYIDVKDRRICKLLLVAHGKEELQWGNHRGKSNPDNLVAFLPAGRPIDLQCNVRYGLSAQPAGD